MAQPVLSSPTPESPVKTIDLFTEHELQLEHQAVRKLDYILIPIMALFFLASFLVRFLLTRDIDFCF